jgi:hypothetical protein
MAPWLAEDNATLEEAARHVGRYGMKAVAVLVPGRCTKSCRQQWGKLCAARPELQTLEIGNFDQGKYLGTVTDVERHIAARAVDPAADAALLKWLRDALKTAAHATLTNPAFEAMVKQLCACHSALDEQLVQLKARLAEMAANGAGDTFPGVPLLLVKEAVVAAHTQVEAKQRYDEQRHAGWTADARPANEHARGHDVYEGDNARVREFREAKAHLMALKNAAAISEEQYTELLEILAPLLKASDPDKFANSADTVREPHKLQQCARALNVLEKVLSAHLDQAVQIRQRASLFKFVEAGFDYAKPYSGKDVVVALPIALDKKGATIALYEYGNKVCAAFYYRRASLNFALKSGRPPNSAWYPGRDGNFDNFKVTSANQRDADGTFTAQRSYPFQFGGAVRKLERVLAASASAPFMDNAITPGTAYQAMRATIHHVIAQERGTDAPAPASVVAAIDDDASEDDDARKRALSVSSAGEEAALARCDDTSSALISAIARAVRGDAVANEENLLRVVSLLRKRDFGPFEAIAFAADRLFGVEDARALPEPSESLDALARRFAPTYAPRTLTTEERDIVHVLAQFGVESNALEDDDDGHAPAVAATTEASPSPPVPQLRLLTVGTRVEARWEGEWCPAIVSQVYEDAYEVEWVDDPEVFNRLDLEDVRVARVEDAAATGPPLALPADAVADATPVQSSEAPARRGGTRSSGQPPVVTNPYACPHCHAPFESRGARGSHIRFCRSNPANAARAAAAPAPSVAVLAMPAAQRVLDRTLAAGDARSSITLEDILEELGSSIPESIAGVKDVARCLDAIRTCVPIMEFLKGRGFGIGGGCDDTSVQGILGGAGEQAEEDEGDGGASEFGRPQQRDGPRPGRSTGPGDGAGTRPRARWTFERTFDLGPHVAVALAPRADQAVVDFIIYNGLIQKLCVAGARVTAPVVDVMPAPTFTARAGDGAKKQRVDAPVAADAGDGRIHA